eukprot:345027-Chlamydomonas_euryale.AAC.1
MAAARLAAACSTSDASAPTRDRGTGEQQPSSVWKATMMAVHTLCWANISWRCPARALKNCSSSLAPPFPSILHHPAAASMAGQIVQQMDGWMDR